MSDFMKWLYAHYIRPQLEAAPRSGYEMSLSLMETDLDPDLRDNYRQAVEFTAIHAFQLGLRTGRGLAEGGNG